MRLLSALALGCVFITACSSGGAEARESVSIDLAQDSEITKAGLGFVFSIPIAKGAEIKTNPWPSTIKPGTEFVLAQQEIWPCRHMTCRVDHDGTILIRIYRLRDSDGLRDPTSVEQSRARLGNIASELASKDRPERSGPSLRNSSTGWWLSFAARETSTHGAYIFLTRIINEEYSLSVTLMFSPHKFASFPRQEIDYEMLEHFTVALLPFLDRLRIQVQ